MTILETHPQARSAMRWTEVCAADHITPARRADRQPTGTAGVAARLVAPTSRSSERSMVVDRVRPSVRGYSGTAPSVAPRRRVLARPAVTDSVRSCRVEAPSVAGVVDDVPTWALLACGIAFGVIMLLAVAFLGGPAYA